MRWVLTILSQSRFDVSIFLSGGLSHQRNGGLQAGKVQTEDCVSCMGQVRNRAPMACSRKGRGSGESYAGRGGGAAAFPALCGERERKAE